MGSVVKLMSLNYLFLPAEKYLSDINKVNEVEVSADQSDHHIYSQTNFTNETNCKKKTSNFIQTFLHKIQTKINKNKQEVFTCDRCRETPPGS